MSRRTGPHAAAYDDLLDRVARVAAQTPTSELVARFGLCRKEVSFLRNRRDGYFGWDRLHTFALELGVPLADVWRKHQRVSEAA